MSAELKPGYKQTEVGVIPEDWGLVDYVSFGQIIDGDRGTHYPAAGDLRASLDSHVSYLT